MSIPQSIINYIEKRRDKNRKSQPGDHGKFWRDGGNELLYKDLPIDSDSLVIDAGGYKGEWASGIMARYGCKIIILEPIPEFITVLNGIFSENDRIEILTSALGGEDRRTQFFLLDNGTSEHRGDNSSDALEANVVNISRLVSELGNDKISCLKLNIEGGEYEVLEKLIEDSLMNRFESFLIQFHQQPAGYEKRYKKIIEEMSKTHDCVWKYSWVWELWNKK